MRVVNSDPNRLPFPEASDNSGTDEIRPQPDSSRDGELEEYRVAVGRWLAGPIVRHTAASGAPTDDGETALGEVSVWGILQTASSVLLPATGARLEVYDGDVPIGSETAPIGSETAPLVPLGERAAAVLVTVRAPLTAGRSYQYRFSAMTRSGGDEPAESAPTEGRPGLTYTDHTLASFVVPGGFDQLTFMHGSCRKTSGEGFDAFAAADDLLQMSIAATTPAGDGVTAGVGTTGPSRRPQVLYLTGDQIYGDDNDLTILWAIVDWIVPAFFGTSDALYALAAELVEREIAGAGDVIADGLDAGLAGLVAADPSVVKRLRYSRQWISNEVPRGGRFTSGAATCHLLGFHEYAAAYLAMWSPTVLLPLDDIDFLQRSLAGAGLPFLAQNGRPLRSYIGNAARVRRLMAHCVTYMVFDDHDVTDDWNLDDGWKLRTTTDSVNFSLREVLNDNDAARELVTKVPPTLHILGAALTANAVFQAWGNTPSRYEGGPARQILLETTGLYGDSTSTHPTKSRARRLAAHWHRLDLLGGLRTLPGKVRWDFTLDRGDHIVIALDTRTWRSGPGPGGAEILSAEGVTAQLQGLTEANVPALRAVFLIAGGPWFGYPILEELQETVDDAAVAIQRILAGESGDEVVNSLLESVELLPGLSRETRERLRVKLEEFRTNGGNPPSGLRSLLGGVLGQRTTNLRGWVATHFDREAPAGNSPAHFRLLAAIQARHPGFRQREGVPDPPIPVVFLSGDVHHGYTVAIRMRCRHNPFLQEQEVYESLFIQLTSSAFQNEDLMTRAIQSTDDILSINEFLSRYRLGWWNPAEDATVPHVDGAEPNSPLRYNIYDKAAHELVPSDAGVEHFEAAVPWGARSARVLLDFGARDRDAATLDILGGVRPPDWEWHLRLMGGDVDSVGERTHMPTDDRLARFTDLMRGGVSGSHVVGLNNVGVIEVRPGDRLEQVLHWGNAERRGSRTTWSIPLNAADHPDLGLAGEAGVPNGAIPWRTWPLVALAGFFAHVARFLAPRRGQRGVIDLSLTIPIPLSRLIPECRMAVSFSVTHTNTGFELALRGSTGLGLLGIAGFGTGAIDLNVFGLLKVQAETAEQAADLIVVYLLECLRWNWLFLANPLFLVLGNEELTLTQHLPDLGPLSTLLSEGQAADIRHDLATARSTILRLRTESQNAIEEFRGGTLRGNAALDLVFSPTKKFEVALAVGRVIGGPLRPLFMIDAALSISVNLLNLAVSGEVGLSLVIDPEGTAPPPPPELVLVLGLTTGSQPSMLSEAISQLIGGSIVKVLLTALRALKAILPLPDAEDLEPLWKWLKTGGRAEVLNKLLVHLQELLFGPTWIEIGPALDALLEALEEATDGPLGARAEDIAAAIRTGASHTGYRWEFAEPQTIRTNFRVKSGRLTPIASALTGAARLLETVGEWADILSVGGGSWTPSHSARLQSFTAILNADLVVDTYQIERQYLVDEPG